MSETTVHYWRELLPELLQEKQQGRRLVFTNGVFDLMHAGHVTYLQQARALGDLLVIGLNDDASTRRLKGDLRPVNRQEHRASVLQALTCVDYVALFGEDTPLDFISDLLPAVLVKGADYTPESIVGGREVMAAGGSVQTVELVAGLSTTALIDRIRTAYGPDRTEKNR